MKQKFLAMILLCFTGPQWAYADPVCLSLDELNAALVDWYGETLVHVPPGQQDHLWVSARTGTWTTARVYADGTACVTAQGSLAEPAALVAALRD